MHVPQFSFSVNMKLTILTAVLLFYSLSVFADISDLDRASRNKLVSKRLYNGRETYINLAPYMALVYTENTDSDLPFCGAAIITTRHLISTAYFFKKHEHADFKVFTGRAIAFPMESQHYHTVKKVFIHEKYDPSEIYHNIALIELREYLQLSPVVKYIKLSTLQSMKKMKFPSTMVVTGYRRQENGMIGYLVDQQVQIRYPQVGNNFTDRLIVLEKNSLDMCYGDSGNPGVIDGNLTALAIFESNYCKGVHGDVPAFFTGIPYYYEWIKLYVGAKRLEKFPHLQ